MIIAASRVCSSEIHDDVRWNKTKEGGYDLQPCPPSLTGSHLPYFYMHTLHTYVHSFIYISVRACVRMCMFMCVCVQALHNEIVSRQEFGPSLILVTASQKSSLHLCIRLTNIFMTGKAHLKTISKHCFLRQNELVFLPVLVLY